MNKIIRKAEYPISKLPEDLREGLDPSGRVSVVVEELNRPDHVMSLDEMFALRGFRRRTAEEIDADIRQMRDEWDD